MERAMGEEDVNTNEKEEKVAGEKGKEEWMPKANNNKQNRRKKG
jgi:hypothetical protein